LPTGPVFHAGHLVEDFAAWRSSRPILDMDNCVGCFMCQVACPEAAIVVKNNRIGILLDFCKGCGICAIECPVGALTMEPEASKHGRS
jgi:pyruvate ferredoxin oxidoreductase delta subunit